MRLRLQFADRVGMVADVARVVSGHGLNILSLEVIPDNMYLEIEEGTMISSEQLIKELAAIIGVRHLELIQLLPHEEREQHLQIVLDSVSDGVIAIDARGRITSLNPAGEKMLGLTRQEALGQSIATLLGPELPILRCLVNGQPYDDHVKVDITGPRGRICHLTSGRCLRDPAGAIVGVVATMKDIAELRQMVYTLAQPEAITFADLIGNAPAFNRVIAMGRMVARGDSTVLLRGESGTGKELFARAIHTESHRRQKPFIAVNCAALPEELLESELFGYVGGAFTGARKEGKPGLFAAAEGGTIFLDEIAEASPAIQAKLLRVLQEGKVRKVGSTSEVPVNVRVIAATHRDLETMVQKGLFREDLYYRLNVVPIYLPPLRERKEDIPLLAGHFLAKLAPRLNRPVPQITPPAISKLMHYS
ncbi:Anaerobic nitric oxide reductase transcription regulator NorR [Neomoorella glycerini]|uniref:Anaerobic nitric oxide reductase transcription regulator NorR n=1 Tax=Neomoorella glycerini TaxID=55779 RepID=A0A6I5ZMX0_9FIRM|nr:sigma 54-interacting transcriptional regulator [Moorella glycerini]QGP91220.1 Anaerobic nitric oxide reductase transcription regulator NorR [Moorella glycerini]